MNLRNAHIAALESWEAPPEARPARLAAADNPSVLAVTELACERGERRLFAGLSFVVHPGELVQIEGTNGSGKTTLLRILCGLTPATAGEVRFVGKSAHEMRHRFAYLGHSPAVTGTLTPLEHLEVAAGLNPHVGPMDAEALLHQVGIADCAETPCRHLSAGQQRRLALARLLLHPVPLWILDEPLTALDRGGVALVHELLRRQLARGGAAVITTHQPLELPVHRRVVLEELPWAL